MKKKLTFLLTTLIMALALCMGAAAAEPVLTGALDSGLTWQIKAGIFTVGTDDWEDHTLVGYYRNGRLIQLQALTADHPGVAMDNRATDVKLFQLEENWTPRFPPIKISLAPEQVITDGIASWDELTTPGTDHYVAPAFAEDCSYFLNGVLAKEGSYALTQLKQAAVLRGTATEFSLDQDGLISQVNCRYYTADQVLGGDATVKALSDGTIQVRVPSVVNSYVNIQNVTGWQGLTEGDMVLAYKTRLPDGSTHYTLEKAEKVTGPVSGVDAERGTLRVNGVDRFASKQLGAGAHGDVSFDADTDGFSRWTDTQNLVDEYDFYLDKGGAIVAAVRRTESAYTARPCLVLSTKVTGDSLHATLARTDGSTETIPVSRIGVNESGRVVRKSVVGTVTSKDRQISVTAARNALTGDAEDSAAAARFFSYRLTDGGYELTELNAGNFPRDWENSVSQGDGSAAFATVSPMAVFVRNPGGETCLDSWGITANATTVFIVGTPGADGTLTLSVYQGFMRVPELDAARITAICQHYYSDGLSYVNTVAKYVYILQA